MNVTDADIDALYGTPRRRAVAKALRPLLLDHDARGLLILAEAALLAVDEDINEREITGPQQAGPTADQHIRMVALQTVQAQITFRTVELDVLLARAEQVAAYIRDGQAG